MAHKLIRCGRHTPLVGGAVGVATINGNVFDYGDPLSNVHCTPPTMCIHYLVLTFLVKYYECSVLCGQFLNGHAEWVDF